jgi:hypothetical protein
MIEWPKAAELKLTAAALVLPMDTATLVYFSGTNFATAGGRQIAAGNSFHRFLRRFPAYWPLHDSGQVPLMNEFLNFVTYDRDTVERNGPRRAAKGIASHVS